MAELYPFQQQLLNGVKAGKISATILGRQVGKSYVNSLLQNWYTTMGITYTPKIKWQRLPGLKLQAYTDDVQPRGFERGLRESDLDPVQAWSIESNCGKRMSFNVWQFPSEKHITMFLMKWSS